MVGVRYSSGTVSVVNNPLFGCTLVVSMETCPSGCQPAPPLVQVCGAGGHG